MKDSFTNLQIFPNESMLFAEEINALTAALHEMWCFCGGFPNRGTIILDGQRKGMDAECIMRMNLKEGNYSLAQVFGDAFSMTSEEMAEKSINVVLAWPEEPAYGYKAQTKCFGEMETGIYQNVVKRTSKRVMVLNTTFGRFLMSAQLAQERSDGSVVELHDESVWMMKGVAMMLARMGKEDLVLQHSVEKLMQGASEIELSLQKELNRFFENCQAPELQAWKEWHEAAMAKGDGLALYFG